MAIPLVRIVNANGRIGKVSATYPPLVRGLLKRVPSEREQVLDHDVDGTAEPESGQIVVELPGRNASTETWRAYATEHGLTSDEANALSRDDLVAFFTTEE